MRLNRKFLSGGIGLVVVVTGAIVVIVLLQPPKTPAPDTTSQDSDTPSAIVSDSVPTAEIVEPVKESPKLPELAFLAGSVEDACGLNEYPPKVGYYDYEDDERLSWANNPFNAEGEWIALESEECRDALEAHIKSLNPYLWMQGQSANQFALVKLENPLTFERVFADPDGDFDRVRDALSRPECLLKNGTVNWELNEECHADAFLNYALINRFCFDDGVDDRERAYYEREDNPTPEQDRLMWKQSLEDTWVREKCERVNETLSLEHHLELYETILTFHDDQDRLRPSSNVILIELAARLGDNAAGLTKSFIGNPWFAQDSQHENGYKYGRFAELLGSDAWKQEQFVAKKEPNSERFEEVITLLTFLEARRPDPRDEIEFDWEWIVQHFCTPPYQKSAWDDEESAEPKSCQEIVHEIRQRDIKFAPLVSTLDKFEQLALELDVYE